MQIQNIIAITLPTTLYQRMWQRSLFRNSQGNFEFIILMLQQDNVQRSYKTPDRQNDTAQRFTDVLANVHLGRQKSRNKSLKKSKFIIFFLLSFFLFLSSFLIELQSRKTQHFLSQFAHRTTLLSSQYLPSPLLSAYWQEWRFSLAMKFPTRCHFEATKRPRFRPALGHAQRLTEGGKARSEQLLVVPTGSLTNREWLPGELLSGSECRRPGWFLDMNYQTCFLQKVFCFLFIIYFHLQLFVVLDLLCKQKPVIDRECPTPSIQGINMQSKAQRYYRMYKWTSQVAFHRAIDVFVIFPPTCNELSFQL